MPYIAITDRTARMADAVTALLPHPAFQTFCDGLLSDLTDKLENEMLADDGHDLYRSQGAVRELRRVLERIYGAQAVRERISVGMAQRVQRERETMISMPGLSRF